VPKETTRFKSHVQEDVAVLFHAGICIPPEMTHLSLIGIPVGGFNPSEKY